MLNEIELDAMAGLIKGVNIPTRPEALQKIMALQDAEEQDVSKYADVIGRDVSLAAGALKAVNSPVFGLRKRITSIPQAATLLGINNIISIVISISLRLEIGGRFGVAVERFWDTANDVALIAAGLANHLKLATSDQAFTLGLFHDCGIPLLMMKFDHYIEVLKEANVAKDGLFTDVEDQAIHTNHCAVGYYVAKTWNLSKRMCLCILNHHQNDLLQSSDHAQNSLLAVLKMAEYISHSRRARGDHAEWQRLKPMVLEFAGLSDDDFSDLAADMGEMLDHAA